MKGKFYYGWWIVVAAFLVMFVCAGIGFSTFPVFLKYLEQDMGWNRTSLSIASMIAALAAGIATPFVGAVVEWLGLRAVMLPGAVLLAGSYLLLGRVHSIHQLWILNIGVGIGLATTTILPAQTLVSRWFERRRGRAMGAVTMANALGSVLWLPLTGMLIESYGWRRSYGILGALIGVVSIPVILFIIRNSPQSMGLEIDGDVGPAEASDSFPGGAIRFGNEGYTVREAIRTNTFWLIVAATFFLNFAASGFGLHVIPFLSDTELSNAQAVNLWAAVQGVSIAARLFFGYLSERYQKRYFAAAANVSRLICIAALLLFAMNVAPFALAAGVLILVYGAGMGCNAVINPLVIGESFGLKSFARILGILGIPYTLGMALGMYSGGKLFDLRSDYILAFSVFGAGFLLAGISIYFAKPCLLFDRLRVRAPDAVPNSKTKGLPLSEEAE
jgi:MFS family permease